MVPHLPEADTALILERPAALPSSSSSIYSLATITTLESTLHHPPNAPIVPHLQSPSLYALDDTATQDGDETLRQHLSPEITLQALPWYKRPSVWWLVPMLAIHVTVMGMLSAPLDQIFINVVCRKHFLEPEGIVSSGSSFLEIPPRCREPDVQGYSALVNGRVSAVLSFIAFFTIGYWTSLADRRGRKLLLAVAILPLSIYLATLLFMQSEYNILPGTGLLYIVAVIRGALGGNMLTDGAVVAYISDCTSVESRSRVTGYIMVIVSMGMIIGSLLGGYVIDLAGGDMTVVLKIGMVSGPLVAFYAATILPESLHLKTDSDDDNSCLNSHDTRQSPSMTQSNATSWRRRLKETLAMVFAPMRLLVPGQLDLHEDLSIVRLPSRYSLLLLLSSRALFEMATSGVQSLLIPYTNVEFDWRHREDAVFIAFMGFSMLLTFVAIFPLCQKLYKEHVTVSAQTRPGFHPLSSRGDDENENGGWDDEDGEEGDDEDDLVGLVGGHRREPARRGLSKPGEDQDRHFEADYHFYLIGILLSAVGFMLVPIYRTEAVFYTSEAFICLGAVANITFMSMMTAIVPAQQTSKMLGGVTVVSTVSMTSSLVLYGWIFAKTAAIWPSFYFCVATLCSLIAFVVGSLAFIWLPRHLLSSPTLV